LRHAHTDCQFRIGLEHALNLSHNDNDGDADADDYDDDYDDDDDVDARFAGINYVYEWFQ
jgi:hypothetical protein